MIKNWLDVFCFSRNPYSTEALYSEEGDKLLVGRDNETSELLQKLTSTKRLPILVGDNGVGKTSIANVVAYRLTRYYEKEKDTKYFFLESKTVRSAHLEDLKSFEKTIYLEVLYLLLSNIAFLKERGISEEEIKATRSLTMPKINAELEVIEIARKWLKTCFSDPYRGGIICIIDNLENGRTSRQVQSIIEDLRDTLFSTTGLLWILCGTSFVLDKANTSKRLEGYLAPIDIKPVKIQDAKDLVQRRIDYYLIRKSNTPEPPVNAELFDYIYKVVRYQLRVALMISEEFAEFLVRHDVNQTYDRKSTLETWLNQKAARVPEREFEIPVDSWAFFDYISDLGCDFSSQQLWLYSLSNEKELSEIAKPLLYKGLIDQVDLDKGYLLRITRDGWLVRYKRKGYSIGV